MRLDSFNRSLQEGYVPGEWKKACVTPLHKGGDPSNIKNYRPISLLSCPSKLFEKLVCSRLVNFLEREGHMGEQQFGFMKGSSIVDQIFELYHRMQTSLDAHHVTKILFVDVSKAFDRV